jgi:hypothetical protein
MKFATVPLTENTLYMNHILTIPFATLLKDEAEIPELINKCLQLEKESQ